MDSTSSIAALKAAQADLSHSLSTMTVNNSSQPWSADLVLYLAIALLVFTLLVLVLSGYLLIRSDASSQQVLRVVGIVTIVSLSVLMLIVGFSNQQLTPVIGLFGAVAGYLLGRDGSGGREKTRDRQPHGGD